MTPTRPSEGLGEPSPSRDLAGRRVFVLGAFAPSLVNFRLGLIDALLRRGAAVAVGAPKSEFSEEHLAMLDARGVAVYDAPVHRHGTGILANASYLWRVRRALRDFRADALIPYTVKPVVFGTIAARSAGIRDVLPLVTGLGSVFIGAPNGRRETLVRASVVALYRVAFALADRVFFQNPDDPRDLREAGALAKTAEFGIIGGSGVNIERFRPGAGDLPDPPRFVMIARLLADKGVREFAEAARTVRNVRPEIEFELIGPFDTNPSAVSPAEVATWSWIRHTPWLDDVRPALAACTAFVLPSYREGTPRSVLEAMALGKAIVTTDAPGCREPVADGVNGFLVPVGEAGPIAEAMLRLAADPDLARRMGHEGRHIIEERYDDRFVYDPMLARLATGNAKQ